ncbi:MAG TPA: N-acetylmuramoyl-L-alanine amidase [Chthoniobacterales bacterium]
MRLIILSVVIFCFVAGDVAHSQISDETRRKREMFLKAREQMKALPPEPTATPAPKPVPTPRKRSTPEPVETPEPRRTPAPTPEPRRTPAPTPEPKQTPRPRQRSESVPSREDSRNRGQATPNIRSGDISISRPGRETSNEERQQPQQRLRGRDVEEAPITIRKSGDQELAELAPAPRGWFGSRWRYLSKGVRRAIDRAPVRRGRWKYIIIHNSGTASGNAKAYDYYHRRTRHMQNGLAYHFVIGNGRGASDGEIEIGPRWTRQINGGHVASDYLNYISLGICLTGDLNERPPTKRQLAALDELIRYLRSRCGKVERRYAIVRGHREINPKPTDCPGNKFPLRWLHRRFD